MSTHMSVEGMGSVQIERMPDECPICRVKVSPIPKFAKASGKPYKAEVIVTFLCTNNECQELFLAYFKKTGTGNNITFNGKRNPLETKDVVIAKAIASISPSFCKIYTQAHKAEELNLLEICGVGYRKSIEFLIKDYASTKYPNEVLKIKSDTLGACIKNYVDDAKVKEVAERATWLGNDETHYERRWIDKDLSDLKLLIMLAMHWIEMELLTAEALASMPPKNGQPKA